MTLSPSPSSSSPIVHFPPPDAPASNAQAQARERELVERLEVVNRRAEEVQVWVWEEERRVGLGRKWLAKVRAVSLPLLLSPVSVLSGRKTDGIPCLGRIGTQGLAIGCTPTTRWSGRRRRGGRWSRGHVDRRGGPHGGAGDGCRRGRRRRRWWNGWEEEHVRGRLLVLATRRSFSPSPQVLFSAFDPFQLLSCTSCPMLHRSSQTLSESRGLSKRAWYNAWVGRRTVFERRRGGGFLNETKGLKE